MTQPDPGSIWATVRAWADAAGLLLPQEEAEDARPKVPQSVCDSCPICQAAATLDQVNPQAVVEMAEMAKSILTGMGSALASAAEQRLAAATAGRTEDASWATAGRTEDATEDFATEDATGQASDLGFPDEQESGE